MSEITEAYDYSVHQKAEGKWKKKRILLIAIYILIPVAIIGTLMVVAPGAAPFGFFTPLITAVAFFFTWGKVNIEHIYSIKAGTVTYSIAENVTNHRKVKEVMNFKLKDCTLIAPYTDPQYKAKFDEFGAETVYDARSSVKAEEVYFAIYTDDDGKKGAFLFEPTNEMIKRCAFQNREATVKTAVRI